MKKMLELLEKDATLTAEQLAVMLDKDPQSVANDIKEYEKKHIIVGYKTIINWEKTEFEPVSAIIELRITPQRGEGFDEVAKRIYQYEEVSSVYLMSGGFDLALIIEGKTMKEVALFVAEKLAPMDQVVSTATHFVLKKYKVDGVIITEQQKDTREVISL
ncbi:MAG: Lrp/AsnC family transcriptional regulator [Ruminococcaceae bacterium]|nr:Lrp/AsnC family transcriptional regulator [Oscillospiraceae bacterium]